jgi:putative integral membrane protein (TIGR02587 family)
METSARLLPAPSVPDAWPDAWHDEIRGLVRAFSGAFLFGIPLLYTMEMWWLGETSGSGRLLVMLGVALLANFALVTAAGFKQETSLAGRLEETLDSVAVGAVGATIVLLVLNEITLDAAPHTILGKIVLQTLPLSIGASLATLVFGGRGGGKQAGADGDAGEKGQRPGIWRALFSDVGATAIGAMFIAASVAPTEEVPTLAAQMQYLHVLALIVFTLVTGYIIVFASGFNPSSQDNQDQPFQHPITETVLSYLVALVVSFGVLALTRQIGTEDSARFILTETLVLGLPAMVGGAAGRLAV